MWILKVYFKVFTPKGIQHSKNNQLILTVTSIKINQLVEISQPIFSVTLTNQKLLILFNRLICEKSIDFSVTSNNLTW